MSTTENKNLYYLHELTGYKVAHEDADVRGWQVYDTNNRLIGKIYGLLVNRHAERVVYLDVEVDLAIIREGFDTYKLRANQGVHGFLNSECEDHLIVPVGMVSLDKERRKVITSGISYDTFLSTKRFDRTTDITREYEFDVFNNYVPDAGTSVTESEKDFCGRTQFR